MTVIMIKHSTIKIFMVIKMLLYRYAIENRKLLVSLYKRVKL